MVRAIYDSIYQDLRNRIENGEYPFQTYLPSEAVLVAHYDCSHNTVRRALAVLAREGYVQPQHGKGVRVIYQPRERALFEIGGIETFKETASRNHLVTTTNVVSFDEVDVDDALARLTSFPVGARVYAIERIRSLDGCAVIRDRNWFLHDLAEGLTPSIAAQSIYEYLEQVRHVVIATSKRTITVERADADDERLLDIEGFDFLAVVHDQTFTDKGAMLEYTQSRHRPDYFSFRQTATRDRRA